MLRVASNEEERLCSERSQSASQLSVGFHQTTIAWMERSLGNISLVLRRMREMSKRYGLRCANVFHAGDGNLHPLILFDANNPAEVKRAEDFGAEILELSVDRWNDHRRARRWS